MSLAFLVACKRGSDLMKSVSICKNIHFILSLENTCDIMNKRIESFFEIGLCKKIGRGIFRADFINVQDGKHASIGGI